MKNEISYIEYKKALLTVELFHRQINEKYNVINDKETKTELMGWIRRTEMSGRVRNILTRAYNYSIDDASFRFKYVEDITKRMFLIQRNAGQQSWAEFEELRSNL